MTFRFYVNCKITYFGKIRDCRKIQKFASEGGRKRFFLEMADGARPIFYIIPKKPHNWVIDTVY